MCPRDPRSIGGTLFPAVSPKAESVPLWTTDEAQQTSTQTRTCRTCWCPLCSWLPVEPPVAEEVTGLQFPLSTRQKLIYKIKLSGSGKLFSLPFSHTHTWHSDWLCPLFEVEQLDNRAQQSGWMWPGPGIKPTAEIQRENWHRRANFYSSRARLILILSLLKVRVE